MILDAFEWITKFQEDWLCSLAQNIHQNILLIIAGRKTPNWSKAWPDWRIKAEIKKLKSFNAKDIRKLTHNYYKALFGNNPKKSYIEKTVKDAYGLPIVATTLVDFHMAFPEEDLPSIKTGVYTETVNKIRKSLPEDVFALLEAASTLRWYNEDILSALTNHTDLNTAYMQLQRCQLIQPSARGLVVHDSFREIIDQNLKTHRPKRHKELHEKASRYFGHLKNKLEIVSIIDEDWQRLALEEIWHLLQVSTDQGMELLHTLFGKGLTYYRYQFCQSLIDDVNSLKIQDPQLTFRLKYYTYCLKSSKSSPGHVSKKEIDEIISESSLDPEIQWEVFLNYVSYLRFAAEHEKAKEYVYKSLELLRITGREESLAGCMILLNLAHTYPDPNIDKEKLLKRALDISHNIEEPLCRYNAFVELGHLYFGRQRYSKAKNMWLKALTVANACRNDERIADAFNRVAQSLIAIGELPEAENHLNAAMKAAKRLPNTLGGFKDKEMYIKRHFGIFHYISGDCNEAIKYLNESAKTYRKRKSTNGFLRTLVLLAECLYEIGDHSELKSVILEIEKVASKASIMDFVARSIVLRANILLDNLNNHTDHSKLNTVLQMYQKAIKIALECNVDALDDTINRILWKLNEYYNSEVDAMCVFLLKKLIDFLKNEQVNGQLLTVVEFNKRKHLSTVELKNPESHALTCLERALQKQIHIKKPDFWQGL